MIIITQKYKQIILYFRTIIPRWEEKLIYNEEFSHFTKDHPNVVILFELIDSAKSKPDEISQTSQETSAKWQRIGWAFLKVCKNYLHILK